MYYGAIFYLCMDLPNGHCMWNREKGYVEDKGKYRRGGGWRRFDEQIESGVRDKVRENRKIGNSKKDVDRILAEKIRSIKCY